MEQMKNIPSETFLFDQQRTGRLKFKKGEKNKPELVWRCRLPNSPPKCAESTPVFDSAGNLYFGCHDGAFYSLDSVGKLRWCSLTSGKIYSSPTIFDDSLIVVASGDGQLLCYDREGNLKWTTNLCGYFKSIPNRFLRKLSSLHTKHHSYDSARKKMWDAYCWASPCITTGGTIYISAFGIGLHAINIENGKTMWTYDLGTPRHHLSGVVIDKDGSVYLASQHRYFHKLSSNGSLIWTFDNHSRFDAWGNPSIDLEYETVYFTLASSRSQRGQVVALGLDGRLKWREKLDNEARGTVAIGYGDYVLVCDFSGFLYFLSKRSGAKLNVVKLSDTIRALWTTPSIDPSGSIFITTKDSPYSGSLYCLKSNGEIVWRYKTGKSLSTPVLDHHGCIYFGSWNGNYLCLQT